MVCMYCTHLTSVVNSRLQRRTNQTWRRRQCKKCKSVFTTIESSDLSGSIVVKCSDRQLVPFSRDKLFLSIYESCKHRTNALQDASLLTQTILSGIIKSANGGCSTRESIIEQVHAVLQRFDKNAATFYIAYHSD
jgi:transcriptional regulator NrdR family protein